MLAFVCIHSIVFQYHPQQGTIFNAVRGIYRCSGFCRIGWTCWNGISFSNPTYGNFDECLHSGSAGTGLQYPFVCADLQAADRL